MKIFILSLLFSTSVFSSPEAVKYFQEKKYEKARDIYLSLHLKRPFDFTVTYNAALCFYYLEDYSNASKFFKKVAEKENQFQALSFYFLSKINFKKKRFKNATSYLGLALAKEGTPTPIYHTFLDQWELLRKKKLSYEEKAKKKFGAVDEKEYFEKAMSRKSLPQPEIKKLRGVLELYQLAWVLNPTSENLQKIVYFYLLLGDENKAVTLLMLLEEKERREYLTGFLSNRRRQIEKRKLKKEVKINRPKVFEIFANVSLLQDSNPTTQRVAVDQSIEQVQRQFGDVGLGINFFYNNKFKTQLKFDVYFDQLKNDPILQEVANINQRTSDSTIYRVSAPFDILSRSTRWTVTPVGTLQRISDISWFSSTGLEISFEKYFVRYGSFFNSWLKNNNGRALDAYDGFNWGGEMGVFRYTKRSKFGLAGGYRIENAGVLGGESFDFIEKGLNFFGERKVRQKINVGFNLRIGVKSYELLRDDTRATLNFFSNYEVLPRLKIGGFYQYLDNQSNVDSYDFNTHQLGVNLSGEYF